MEICGEAAGVTFQNLFWRSMPRNTHQDARSPERAVDELAVLFLITLVRRNCRAQAQNGRGHQLALAALLSHHMLPWRWRGPGAVAGERFLWV